jgi:hypothetical protein
MAYQVTVIPVMIASPGDVNEEREIIRAVIHDWNDINARASRVMLSAVGWDTHASPELGARPQQLINDRILTDCDLLIGVFWTRLGTPTGKAASGTVEEIEAHVASGKPAMLYFSSRPVAPDSIDPAQYANVREAKAKWMQRGLVEGFDDSEELRHKLSKQLSFCLAKNSYLQGIIGTPREEDGNARAAPVELSAEARTLLKAGASQNDGHIWKLAFGSGEYIQAGEQTFGEGNNREMAKWEAALEELLHAQLVVARGTAGELFELTHEGWTMADKA